MPFVKLDCGMLNSTTWFDREAREVFITSLLMAHPYYLAEPTEQIDVRSQERIGWIVPVGDYGFVPAAGVGIANRAGLDQDVGLNALMRLCAPEPESRSPEYEGRRMARIPGGYLILNFMRFREHDYTGAERQRKYRQRLKERNTVTQQSNAVIPVTVTHADADADADADKAKSQRTRATRSLATRLPEGWNLTPERKAVAEKENLDAGRTFDRFTDYWKASSGAKARKHDWDATWRNWCRSEADRKPGVKVAVSIVKTAELAELESHAKAIGFRDKHPVESVGNYRTALMLAQRPERQNAKAR